ETAPGFREDEAEVRNETRGESPESRARKLVALALVFCWHSTLDSPLLSLSGSGRLTFRSLLFYEVSFIRLRSFSAQPHAVELAPRAAGMAIPSVSHLVELIRKSALLPREHSEQLGELERSCTETRALAQALIERGWLTPFQVEHLLLNRVPQLTIG